MQDVVHFQQRLTSEQARLRRQLGWVTQEATTQDHSIQESMPQSGDDEIADSATSTYLQELDEALVQRAKDQLDAIESALQRIEVGQYGRCLNCGQEISAARLEALPWTPYCRNCAQDLEALD